MGQYTSPTCTSTKETCHLQSKIRGKLVASMLACSFLALILMASYVDSATLHDVARVRPAKDRGCYYMLKHYKNGDQIETDESCLNCTCENSMLMCFLRVCPYIRPIGDKCLIERVKGECCPKITCPSSNDEQIFDEESPNTSSKAQTLLEHIITTTSPSSASNSTVVGLIADSASSMSVGCHVNGKHYAEGALMPTDPTKPCEICYCIKNSSACIMQDCALEVSGCTPIYHADGCCPSRYNCSAADTKSSNGIAADAFWKNIMSSTTALSNIFSSTTTARPPNVLPDFNRLHPATHGCRTSNSSKIYAEGQLVPSKNKCEHCYCLKNEIVCAVQECRPPCEGCIPILDSNEDQCCPKKYECIAPTKIVPNDNLIDETTTTSNNATATIIPTTATSTSGPMVVFDVSNSTEPPSITTLPLNASLTYTERSSKADTSSTYEYNMQTTPMMHSEISTIYYQTTKPPQKQISPKMNEDESPSPETLAHGSENDKLNKNDAPHIVDGFSVHNDREQELDSMRSSGKFIVPEGSTAPASSVAGTSVAQNTEPSSDSLMRTSQSAMPTTLSSPLPRMDTINENAPAEQSNLDSDELSRRPKPPKIPNAIPGEGSCRYNGRVYANGAEVKSKDVCMEVCLCINSVVYCDDVDCPKLPENIEQCERILREGECCPHYICSEPKSNTTVAEPQLSSPGPTSEVPTSTKFSESKQDSASVTTTTLAPTTIKLTDTFSITSTATTTSSLPETTSSPVSSITEEAKNDSTNQASFQTNLPIADAKPDIPPVSALDLNIPKVETSTILSAINGQDSSNKETLRPLIAAPITTSAIVDITTLSTTTTSAFADTTMSTTTATPPPVDTTTSTTTTTLARVDTTTSTTNATPPPVDTTTSTTTTTSARVDTTTSTTTATPPPVDTTTSTTTATPPPVDTTTPTITSTTTTSTAPETTPIAIFSTTEEIKNIVVNQAASNDAQGSDSLSKETTTGPTTTSTSTTTKAPETTTIAISSTTEEIKNNVNHAQSEPSTPSTGLDPSASPADVSESNAENASPDVAISTPKVQESLNKEATLSTTTSTPVQASTTSTTTSLPETTSKAISYPVEEAKNVVMDQESLEPSLPILNEKQDVSPVGVSEPSIMNAVPETTTSVIVQDTSNKDVSVAPTTIIPIAPTTTTTITTTISAKTPEPELPTIMSTSTNEGQNSVVKNANATPSSIEVTPGSSITTTMSISSNVEPLSLTNSTVSEPSENKPFKEVFLKEAIERNINKTTSDSSPTVAKIEDIVMTSPSSPIAASNELSSNQQNSESISESPTKGPELKLTTLAHTETKVSTTTPSSAEAYENPSSQNIKKDATADSTESPKSQEIVTSISPMSSSVADSNAPSILSLKSPDNASSSVQPSAAPVPNLLPATIETSPQPTVANTQSQSSTPESIIMPNPQQVASVESAASPAALDSSTESPKGNSINQPEVQSSNDSKQESIKITTTTSQTVTLPTTTSTTTSKTIETTTIIVSSITDEAKNAASESGKPPIDVKQDVSHVAETTALPTPTIIKQDTLNKDDTITLTTTTTTATPEIISSTTAAEESKSLPDNQTDANVTSSSVEVTTASAIISTSNSPSPIESAVSENHVILDEPKKQQMTLENIPSSDSFLNVSSFELKPNATLELSIPTTVYDHQTSTAVPLEAQNASSKETSTTTTPVITTTSTNSNNQEAKEVSIDRSDSDVALSPIEVTSEVSITTASNISLPSTTSSTTTTMPILETTSSANPVVLIDEAKNALSNQTSLESNSTTTEAKPEVPPASSFEKNISNSEISTSLPIEAQNSFVNDASTTRPTTTSSTTTTTLTPEITSIFVSSTTEEAKIFEASQVAPESKSASTDAPLGNISANAKTNLSNAVTELAVPYPSKSELESSNKETTTTSTTTTSPTTPSITTSTTTATPPPVDTTTPTITSTTTTSTAPETTPIAIFSTTEEIKNIVVNQAASNDAQGSDSLSKETTTGPTTTSTSTTTKAPETVLSSTSSTMDEVKNSSNNPADNVTPISIGTSSEVPVVVTSVASALPEPEAPMNSTIIDEPIKQQMSPEVSPNLNREQEQRDNATTKVVTEPSPEVASEAPLTTRAPTHETTVDTNSTSSDPNTDYEEVPDAEAGCEYEGKTYNSAEQIPRSHPCDFCFCFRGDIICLQQTCPPPVPHCFETIIDGFCCPRYECPVRTTRANSTNLSLSTAGGDSKKISLHGQESRAGSHNKNSNVKGCFVDNKLYAVGQVVESASGPCLECKCDRNGMMKCNPKECTPEDPLLQQINREVLQSTLSRTRRSLLHDGAFRLKSVTKL